jgi:hypothetical protein
MGISAPDAANTSSWFLELRKAILIASNSGSTVPFSISRLIFCSVPGGKRSSWTNCFARATASPSAASCSSAQSHPRSAGAITTRGVSLRRSTSKISRILSSKPSRHQPGGQSYCSRITRSVNHSARPSSRRCPWRTRLTTSAGESSVAAAARALSIWPAAGAHSDTSSDRMSRLVVRGRRKIPSVQEPVAAAVRLPEPRHGYGLSASHH